MSEITQPSFNTLYANVPDDQRETFHTFRTSHPMKTTEVNDVSWTYMDSGTGDKVVLLLVGGLRKADAAWKSVPMLEDEFRVITPSYPTLNTMTELADGLAGILEAENIDSAHVLAGSFGGMLAQIYVRRHPQKVNKLILSTTAVLDDANIKQYQQALAMVDSATPEQVAELAPQMMFTIIAPPENLHDFYRAYLHELYTYRIDKEELLSTYRCLLDFAQNTELSAEDLANWQGQLLILESDDDATFDEETRSAVRAIYPQAQTHTFHGAGHSPGTTQRDLYYQVVKDFLRN